MYFSLLPPTTQTMLAKHTSHIPKIPKNTLQEHEIILANGVGQQLVNLVTSVSNSAQAKAAALNSSTTPYVNPFLSQKTATTSSLLAQLGHAIVNLFNVTDETTNVFLKSSKARADDLAKMALDLENELKLKAVAANVSVDITNINTKIADLKSNLDTSNATAAGIQNEVDVINTAKSQIEIDLATLQTQTNAIDLSAIENQLANLTTTLEEEKAKTAKVLAGANRQSSLMVTYGKYSYNKEMNDTAKDPAKTPPFQFYYVPNGEKIRALHEAPSNNAKNKYAIFDKARLTTFLGEDIFRGQKEIFYYYDANGLPAETLADFLKNGTNYPWKKLTPDDIRQYYPNYTYISEDFPNFIIDDTEFYNS